MSADQHIGIAPWYVTANSWQCTTVYDGHGRAVAHLDLEDWGVTEENQGDLEKQQAEIANVICMSPLLLRALKQMIETHGKPHREEWINGAAFDAATKVDAFARAVIAKAETVGASAVNKGE